MSMKIKFCGYGDFVFRQRDVASIRKNERCTISSNLNEEYVLLTLMIRFIQDSL